MTYNGVVLDPRLPKPVAGPDYKPKILDSSNPNIKYSHQNGFKAELELANRIANTPNQQVLKYGDAIGRNGSDVISVNTKTGQVTLWDSKYRSGNTKIKTSPTFSKVGPKESARQEAIEAVTSSNLPTNIKSSALKSLDDKTYKSVTSGAGNGKNSVID